MFLRPHLIINRKYLPDCTVGFARAGNGLEFHFYTLELPWLDNEKNISCIPEGEYWVNLRKDKPVFQFESVPNRTYIQIHPGNYTKQILGCILPGDSIKHLDSDGVCDVANSETAMKKLLAILPSRFLIRIES